MIHFENELNAEQVAIVKNASGPCLVLAGAGSGKTRTICYRVAYLLEQGVAPKEMLLVTFTNKAAKEMTERIQQMTQGEIRLPWSGTFHSIACKILKQYAPLLGYSNAFTILDSGDSVDLIKQCIKLEGVDTKQRRFPSARVVLSLISFAKNAQKTIEEVLDDKYPKWLDFTDTILRIAQEYEKRKRLANAMDFDDLLTNMLALLVSSPSVKERFAHQFTHVMVDEYQDTNRVQAAIISLLSSRHNNLLVVGDDAQSIYSFRAANIANILDFEKTYNTAQIFKLETNYRSTPNILDVANCVITKNTEQYEKTLASMQPHCSKPELHAFADTKEEAEFITETIATLHNEGVPLSQIAVLFRAAFHSQALEVELVKRNIPYEYRGGVRFFERAHIKDTLAFLRIIHNPKDEIAWNRVLTMQTGIGPASAQKIIHAIKNSEEDISLETLQECGSLLSVKAKIGWHDFMNMWQSVCNAKQEPAHMIDALLESKYAEYIEGEYVDYRERLQDIEQLATFASANDDLHTFLTEVTLQENFTIAQAQKQQQNNTEEKIVLSTIHQAKGLEWHTVFVMHMSQGQFPNERAMGERNGIEEERRLFYVAITRAKKQLFFSYPITSQRHMVMNGPSMFLEEIDKRLIEEFHFGGSTVFFGNENDQKSLLSFTDPGDDIDNIEYIPEDEPVWSRKGKTNFLGDINDF
ncbi:MAG: hypothetical protein CL685_01095 [Candidatus Magasanikbacteria bacterium]|nr:hypothetical protein [Candidatus Magasanikbacteria bacterium]|tara:strand:+ start:810 stop:2894 length:2085 start_codon:yes stop_codon:yes gene_type:complete